MTAVTLAVAIAACGGKKNDDDVVQEENVIAIFTAFQPTIMKIMSAGIAAKSTSASGANIPVIGLVGAVQGTGGIGGQVAQSTGQNQNLNLWVELDDYSDTGDVIFQTDNTSDATKLQFDLGIQNQPPDNTMTGDLDGQLTAEGEEIASGTATFDLHFVSDLVDDDNAPDLICTHVTGTVATASLSSAFDFVLAHMTLTSAQQAACEAL